jgi:hypothetical protein
LQRLLENREDHQIIFPGKILFLTEITGDAAYRELLGA